MPMAVRSMVSLAMLVLLGLCLGSAAGLTCEALTTQYETDACQGNDATELSSIPGCGYSFALPACSIAEPQSPRDLTDGAAGQKVPKAATLNDEQAQALPLANVHFHLGAEHKSGEYSSDADSIAYDAAHSGRRLAANPRPGFMCSSPGELTSEQTASYSFQHCQNVEVGKSYEVHYVHSSAGTGVMGDGLGGAANGRGILNPMIVVEAQVFEIVNDGPTINNMLHGWTVVGHENSVMYPGSTTGPSHNNEFCSPYAITWHVDKTCHRVSPASFDNLCQQMRGYNFVADVAPHGSRKLVSPQFVCEPEFVQPLA
mmetsp:Transcript_38606/g.111532  ORF Transcript_38606/g.111532 Transcript_38606/m.111532 type:complete len:314 (+) Transcript_38606:69-1010(+)